MINVLIVEDEEAIANLIKISLSQAGYLTHIVNDGEKAIEEILKNSYDLVLLDVMIPKVSGYEVMEYVRDLNVPVIFITALSQVNDKVKGLKLGAEDYITKPFDIEELLARVEVVLRKNNKVTDVITYKDIEIMLVHI